MKTISKLFPLIFFIVMNCSSQYIYDRSDISKTKFSKLEFYLKNIDSDNKLREYLKLDFKKTNIRNKKIEETISQIGIPFGNRINWLINTYYDFLYTYNELKKLQNSFTSYDVINHEDINIRFYLSNSGNLKDINEYGASFKLRVKVY